MVVGHSGTLRSFRAFFYLAPEPGAAVICAMSTAGEAAAERIRAELRAMVLEMLVRW